MKITNNRDSVNKIKTLVYSQSGVGKTRLIATCPRPVIISSEKKLVSISGSEFPEFTVLEVTNYKDCKKALKWIKKNLKDFDTICVDSASHIAEKLVMAYQKEGLSVRDVYGSLATDMTAFLSDLLEIEKHIYVIAKAKRIETAEGDEKYHPAMPGRVLPANLPYMFDEVFALRISDAEEEDGETYRYLQTQPSENYEAKDSSDRLDKIEKPDLGEIFKKIAAPKKEKAKKKKGKKGGKK